jgi:hypothetical protein
MADEPGMDKDELRKLLMVAKKTPVNAAIGMLKDGRPALLLHKIKQPRTLSKELESSGDLKNMRWGDFHVDGDKDPKTLVARLNKPAAGLARRLVKAVKFAGFSKVVLEFEDGTTEEGGDEEEAEETAAAPQAAALQAPDLGPVRARLTACVKRMMPLIAADASRGDTLRPLAKAAQAAIQAGDAAHATAAADALEKAVAGFEAPAVVPADPAALAKARSAWIGVRQKVDGDLGKLLDAVRTTYKDHPGRAEIERFVQQQLNGVREALDGDLADKLDEMGKAPASDRPKLAVEAKQIAARYQQHLATDKVLGALDDNPFVPLTVQKIVTAALSVIVRTIH